MSFEGNAIFSSEELNNLVRHGGRPEVNREIVDADFSARPGPLLRERLHLQPVRSDRGARRRHAPDRVSGGRSGARARTHREYRDQRRRQDQESRRPARAAVRSGRRLQPHREIVQGLRNLYNTQYFSAVTPDTPPGSAEGLMDVVITVEEQSTADIRLRSYHRRLRVPVCRHGALERAQPLRRRPVDRGRTGAVARQAVLEPSSLSNRGCLARAGRAGLNLGLERSVVRSVQQDILPPVFDDPDRAAPDPYESREECEQARGRPASPRPAVIPWSSPSGTSSSAPPPPTAFPTSLGIVRFSGGLSSTLRFLTYDTAIYRPFEKTIRDDRENWVMVNRMDLGVAWTAATSS